MSKQICDPLQAQDEWVLSLHAQIDGRRRTAVTQLIVSLTAYAEYSGPGIRPHLPPSRARSFPAVADH
jgi:hypothetical protein